MIKLKKSIERSYNRNGGQEVWDTFNSRNPFDPEHNGFRSLESFREERLRPGSGYQLQASRNLEIVTYVSSGALILEDAAGRTVALEAGECHRTGAKTGSLHRGTNASRTEVRIFQGLFTPDRALLQTPPENRRFSMTERRGVLRLLVSQDGREGSLRLRQDARVYSSILDPGHHLIHEMGTGRGAWLHVIGGRILLSDRVMDPGDGASLQEEAAVSLTAHIASEFLLFDLR